MFTSLTAFSATARGTSFWSQELFRMSSCSGNCLPMNTCSRGCALSRA